MLLYVREYCSFFRILIIMIPFYSAVFATAHADSLGSNYRNPEKPSAFSNPECMKSPWPDACTRATVDLAQASRQSERTKITTPGSPRPSGRSTHSRPDDRLDWTVRDRTPNGGCIFWNGTSNEIYCGKKAGNCILSKDKSGEIYCGNIKYNNCLMKDGVCYVAVKCDEIVNNSCIQHSKKCDNVIDGQCIEKVAECDAIKNNKCVKIEVPRSHFPARR